MFTKASVASGKQSETRVIWVALLTVTTLSCSGASAAPAKGAAPERASAEVMEGKLRHVFFDGKLQGGWEFHGWAPFQETPKGMKMDLSSWGGVILTGRAPIEGVRAVDLTMTGYERVKGRLGLALLADSTDLPEITIVPSMVTPLEGEVVRIQVPISMLNPGGTAASRLRLRGMTPRAGVELLVHRLSFVEGKPPPVVAPKYASKTVEAKVRCSAKGFPISKDIYGMGYGPIPEKSGPQDFGVTSWRLGGNANSRLHPQNAVRSSAFDWYFKNHEAGAVDWRVIERRAREEKMSLALSIPILGWVAKDGTSGSYSREDYPNQAAFDPETGRYGTGVTKAGDPLPPPPPATTSVKMTEAMFSAQVAELKKGGDKTPKYWLLGNEPMLWYETHRDVHPEPTTYDELLEKTVTYARLARKLDPDAVIGGPGLWGWPAYFYSAKDKEIGFVLKPDRRAHEDEPLITWWLKEMKKRGDKEKLRLVDALDIHFYPQMEKVYSPSNDRETVEARMAETRSLWDPSWKHPGWIAERVELLPRMRRMLDEVDPSLKLVIGEYSFGAEDHISGAVAQAESLGRFAQHQVSAAWFWGLPKSTSPLAAAFRAYRNFDGKGGRFLDEFVPTDVPSEVEVSVFTSRSDDKLVMIIVNRDLTYAYDTKLGLKGCGARGSATPYAITQLKPDQLVAGDSVPVADTTTFRAPPLSVTVVAIDRKVKK